MRCVRIVVALLFARISQNTYSPTQRQTHTHTTVGRSLTLTSKLQTERQSVKQDCRPLLANPVALHTPTADLHTCVCVCVCTYFLFGFLDIFMAKLVLCRLCWRCELRAVAVAVAVLLLRKPAPKSVSVCSAAQPRTWLLCLSFYTQVNNDFSKSAINSLTLASSTSLAAAVTLLATQTAKVCPQLMTSVGNFFNLNKRKRTPRIHIYMYIQICTQYAYYFHIACKRRRVRVCLSHQIAVHLAPL